MTLEHQLIWAVYFAACYGKKLRRNTLKVQKKSFQTNFDALQSYCYNCLK